MDSLSIIFLILILIVVMTHFAYSVGKEATISKLTEENKRLKSINALLKEEADENSILSKKRSK